MQTSIQVRQVGPLLPLSVLLLGASLTACRIVPDSFASPTPQRPTLSADTSTTAKGTWELEAGVSVDPGDAFATPHTLKHGLGRRTEVFATWSPLVGVDRRGRSDETGIGDLVLGARHRVRSEDAERPSIAIQPSLKLPLADEDEGLGSGELDAGVAAIATQSVSQVTITTFYQLDLLGNPDGGADVGHQLALAGSQAIDDEFGVFAEIAAVLVPEIDLESVFTTIGGNYVVSPSTILDAGIVLGISDEAPDFQLVFGVTSNFGTPKKRRTGAED